jgi:hypothetical protein
MRWIRRVLPPRWTIVVFGLVYVLFLGVDCLFRFSDVPIDYDASGLRAGLVLATCAGFGVFRVVGFHPACRPRYFEWLRTVPWHARAPLPGGPVALSLQDVVVVAILAGLGVGAPDAAPLTCVVVFLLPYVMMLTAVNACTESWPHAYVAAFGLGLLARVGENDVARMFVLAGMYVVATAGLRRALAQFPWDTPLMTNVRAFFSSSGLWSAHREPRGGLNRLGFPYELLKYRSDDPKIPLRHALLLSLLAAWGAHVLLWSLDAVDRTSTTAMVYIAVPIGAAFFRMIIYCGELWPPISVLGRIATQRWIIPDYDRVFLAPLGTLVLGLGVAWTAVRLSIPGEIGGAIAVFVVFLVALGVAPTLGGWRLLGEHRSIAPLARADLIKL